VAVAAARVELHAVGS
jgi:hypothetical protein